MHLHWKQTPKFTEEIDKIVKNIKIFVQLVREFLNRKNTAVLLIESSFFKKRELEDLMNNDIGSVLEKYEKVIIIIPDITLTHLEENYKFKKDSKSKKLIKKIKELNYQAKMKKTILGFHQQVSKSKVVFLFPNEYDEENHFLTHELKRNPDEKEFFFLARKFAKLHDCYITGFNQVLWRYCRRSPANITHLNPFKLNEERIGDEYFLQYS